jgi:LmbE family N-acetylglucosaminyl deacetylase
MGRKIVVIAPHPDDETLGCGGTLLKHKAENDEVHWLTVTGISPERGFSREAVEKREHELTRVAKLYSFDSVHHLRFPTMMLDTIPMGEIVKAISAVFRQVQPEIVYMPYRGDIHTDHHVVFDAVASCTKWFRYPSVKRVLAYETLSETDFGMNPDNNGFRPNVFVDISAFLQKKIDIMNVYDSEVAEFPFPRSSQAIQALATLRGAAAGCRAAEAFMLLKEII